MIDFEKIKEISEECTEKILKKYRIPFNKQGLGIVNQLLHDDYGVDIKKWKVTPIIVGSCKNWKIEKI